MPEENEFLAGIRERAGSAYGESLANPVNMGGQLPPVTIPADSSLDPLTVASLLKDAYGVYSGATGAPSLLSSLGSLGSSGGSAAAGAGAAGAVEAGSGAAASGGAGAAGLGAAAAPLGVMGIAATLGLMAGNRANAGYLKAMNSPARRYASAWFKKYPGALTNEGIPGDVKVADDAPFDTGMGGFSYNPKSRRFESQNKGNMTWADYNAMKGFEEQQEGAAIQGIDPAEGGDAYEQSFYGAASTGKKLYGPNIDLSSFGYGKPKGPPVPGGKATLPEQSSFAKQRSGSALQAPGGLNFNPKASGLQQRTQIATGGTAGNTGQYRTPEVQRFYKDLAFRTLTDEAGTPTGTPTGVERQYARDVLGVQPQGGSTASFLSSLLRA